MANDETSNEQPRVRRQTTPGRWDGVALMPYKQADAAPFRDVTRQVLFADPNLACEWRYFEVDDGGHSTLERHAHVHAVMIHRGRGQCLVGSTIGDVAAGDLVFIPPMTWHQFRANAGDCLGFLCVVNAERDRPQLPGEGDLAELRANPAVADFIRTCSPPE
ncbi:cupin domain-containing protein [Rhodopseudomonas palustris]|uniref:cupin domain-containing protein n=1 Tax=Rhodopseudomonas palustris TaxID=1076 RepID=UPI002ACD238B|nr:cupin domain-containing protein [Rhodopseudomonas palustris]WQH00389.1 cupin domain-containing protein [Rhodopseudomonas palustris]